MEKSGPLGQFTESLDRLGVEWTRTTPDGVVDVLGGVVQTPSIGAPIEGISLESLGISVEPTPREVREAVTGVTAAFLGVADYGTVVIESGPDATEAASLFPELHVAVLSTKDVVPDMPSALERLGPRIRERATTAILATGPSATADMGALVKGAHGPKDVHVILVDDDRQ